MKNSIPPDVAKWQNLCLTESNFGSLLPSGTSSRSHARSACETLSLPEASLFLREPRPRCLVNTKYTSATAANAMVATSKYQTYPAYASYHCGRK